MTNDVTLTLDTGVRRAVRSLYVHVPFCAHRCGYCAFVTTDARPELHERYVSGLQREFAVRRGELALPAGGEHDGFDTIFVGGGTPTLLAPAHLERLVEWLGSLLRPGGELTIECNPETVTPELARLLVGGGVSRVSLGAQSFTPHVLTMLERRASPETVRRSVDLLRTAGVGQLNLDVLWGVPEQHARDHAYDLAQVVALEPDHVSAYELEFKPGTRLTRRFAHIADPLGDSADDMYDRVVDTLEAAGYHWYETANFARDGRICRHNLAYWNADDHMGIGIGAVGTIAGNRRTNLPNIVRWLDALERGSDAPSRIERLDERTQRLERIMLGLRLDRTTLIDPSDIADEIVSRDGLATLAKHGLARVEMVSDDDGDEGCAGATAVRLTRRGRMLLNSVLGVVLNVRE